MSELEPRNTIDELTGLPNFATFIAMAQHVLNDPTERKDIAFVYFNLENFRSYNEAYGLAAGNDCLVTVARTIEAFFPQELCGRIASDHFGVLTDKADLEFPNDLLWEMDQMEFYVSLSDEYSSQICSSVPSLAPSSVL